MVTFGTLIVSDKPQQDPASRHLRDVLDTLSKSVTLKQGEVLFDEGEIGDALYSLEAGRLEVSVLSPDGRKLVLDIVRPGAIVGEIALFDPGPRTATLTALEPARLRRVSNTDMTQEIRQNPEIAIDLIRLAGKRMRWMNHQLGDQVFLPLPERLARRILYLSDEGRPNIQLNQTQLAGFVGATREGVSNILRQWQQDGLLKLTRGGFQILDRPSLERIAEDTPY